MRLTGGARGGFDLATRRGFVDDARGLGAVDSLLRVALSLVLPTLDKGRGFLVQTEAQLDAALTASAGPPSSKRAPGWRRRWSRFT